MQLPIGIDSFAELASGQYWFADKSLLAKAFVESGAKVTLIPRPRRFGKTINLSMLDSFFNLQNASHNAQLFTSLAITQHTEFCRAHQGQYPVVMLSLKGLKEVSFANALQSFKILLSKLYQKHAYLLDSPHFSAIEKADMQSIIAKQADETLLKTSLADLIDYLARFHQQKVIVLIDEYDTPMQASYVHGYLDEMKLFLSGFLGGGLKGQENLYKALITGILRIAQANIFSDLNNIKVYSVLQSGFSAYFGFTQQDVDYLVAQVGNPAIDKQNLQQWYNGYHVGNDTIYNPWSIVNYLSDPSMLRPYWLNTSDNQLIKQQISQAGLLIKKQFQALLQGELIEHPLNENLVFEYLHGSPRHIWSLLLFAGYLTVEKQRMGEDGLLWCRIRIPNKEVMSLYMDMVQEWFDTENKFLTYQEFMQCLVNGDVARFQSQLQTYINESGSYFDFNQHTQEQVYQVLVLGMVVGLREHYWIQSNIESGDGRSDILLTPKDPSKAGIILELKRSKDEQQLHNLAKQALKQIKNKGYCAQLRQHGVKQILGLGIAFAGKKVLIEKENLQ
jgi:hypothetical protein